MLGQRRQRPQGEGYERGRGWWPPSVHTQTYSPDRLAKQSDSVWRLGPHNFSIETEIPAECVQYHHYKYKYDDNVLYSQQDAQ